MQIIEKPLKEVIPYEKNPRRNDPAVDAVAKSIEQFGFKQPIVIDADGVIVAGHTRYKAARKLKLKTVPCVMADDLTPEQIKAYRIADNSTNSLAEWDAELLLAELADLPEYDFSEFGLTDIDELLKGLNVGAEVIEDDFDADAEAEVITEPVTQRGDVWTLGRHKLMCGDSTDGSAVARLMSGASAELAFTDPPYGVNRDKGFGGANGFGGKGKPIKRRTYSSEWDAQTPDKSAFDLIINNSEKAIIFGGNFFTDKLPVGTFWLVWDKRNTMPTFGDCELAWTNIERKSVKKYDVLYNGLIGKESERFHPTQKPIKLCADIIKDFSETDETVLDLFGGSGSTLIAAEQTGRICFMMELDPVYCDVIVKRYIKHKGSSTGVYLERDGQRVKYDDVTF